MSRLSCDDRAESLLASFTEERIFSAKHLVKHDAETEDVGATIQLLATRLLWRHVSDRTDYGTTVRRLIARPECGG